MGHSVDPEWGVRDPLRGVLRACGQTPPISAPPEPAQCSALVLVLTSHTLFLRIFIATSMAVFNVNRIPPLFCLKPTADFLPLTSRLHPCPLLTVHFTQCSPSLVSSGHTRFLLEHWGVLAYRGSSTSSNSWSFWAFSKVLSKSALVATSTPSCDIVFTARISQKLPCSVIGMLGASNP